MAWRVRLPTRTDLPPSRRVRDTPHVLGGGQAQNQSATSAFVIPAWAIQTIFLILSGALPLLSLVSNVAGRYRVYRKLWSFPRCLGLWDYPPYWQRKEATGHSTQHTAHSTQQITTGHYSMVHQASMSLSCHFPPHILFSSYLNPLSCAQQYNCL